VTSSGWASVAITAGTSVCLLCTLHLGCYISASFATCYHDMFCLFVLFVLLLLLLYLSREKQESPLYYVAGDLFRKHFSISTPNPMDGQGIIQPKFVVLFLFALLLFLCFFDSTTTARPLCCSTALLSTIPFFCVRTTRFALDQLQNQRKTAVGI